MNKLRIVVIAVVLAVIAALIGIVSMSQANATDGGDNECVPSEAWTETIEHDAVTHVVHHEAVTEVVHHDAVTHVVHHEAVPAGPDLWWNWSPNHQQGPFDGPPAFPVDERGTWQGPHENGGPSQDTYGTFQQGDGHGSWFHRDHGTPGVDAYDETVVDQEAYDETVVVTEAYDETVVDQEAYTETIEHEAVVCNGEPVVTVQETSLYACGDAFATVTTTTTTTPEEGEPTVEIVETQVAHAVVACDTPDEPNQPVNQNNPPAPVVPVSIDAGL